MGESVYFYEREKNFPKLLGKEREARNISCDQLGKIIDRSPEYVSAIEKGFLPISHHEFMLISNLLDIKFPHREGEVTNFWTQKELETLWQDFSDLPVDENECIDEDFYIWEKGTNRYEIWHWFDDHCLNGLAKDLMGLDK